VIILLFELSTQFERFSFGRKTANEGTYLDVNRNRTRFSWCGSASRSSLPVYAYTGLGWRRANLVR
jgi:hypothetical protein